MTSRHHMRPRLRPDPSSFLVEIFVDQRRGARARDLLHADHLVQALLLLHVPRDRSGPARARLGCGARRGLAAAGGLPTRSLLAGCTPGGRGGVSSGYVAIAVMPLDTLALWDRRPDRPASSPSCNCSAICLGLYVSFLPIGMSVATLFARRPDDINRLYFSDLAGAALACLVVVPLMAWIGPVSLIAGVAAILLLVAVRLADRRARYARRIVWRSGIAAAVAGRRARARRWRRTSAPRRARACGRIRRPGRVRLERAVPGRRAGVPRATPSSSTTGSGARRSGRGTATRRRSTGSTPTTGPFPFAALGEPPERMLIIGAAGGNEIAAALHFGAEQIDAVELNPETAGLLRGQYADYSGNLTDPARRQLHRRRRPELPRRVRRATTT